MITPEDLDYHHDDESDYTWTETYYIPVSVPEERIFGHVYVAARPVLGSMQADVRIHGAVSNTEFEALYIDSQNHLPAPERFSDIQAPNGLRVHAVRPPRDYRIDYVGYDDTELHLDYVGLMNPWDIHDPDLNPLAGGSTAEQYERSSMGSGYKGHFDMHAKVTGTIKVRGKEYDVDIVDRMNHSWGPRPELDIPPMNSLWAQFGEGLGFRFHMSLDPALPTGADQRFAHGYLLEDGEVHAIMDVEMQTTRLGTAVIAVDAKVTDQRGKSWQLRGIPLCGGPWRAYSNAVCWIGLVRWELDGTIGHGSLQENHSLQVETRMRGRRWVDGVPALTG